MGEQIVYIKGVLRSASKFGFLMFDVCFETVGTNCAFSQKKFICFEIFLHIKLFVNFVLFPLL